jgi:hypothetical protein
LRSKTDSRQLRPQLLIGWSTYKILSCSRVNDGVTRRQRQENLPVALLPELVQNTLSEVWHSHAVEILPELGRVVLRNALELLDVGILLDLGHVILP